VLYQVFDKINLLSRGAFEMPEFNRAGGVIVEAKAISHKIEWREPARFGDYD